MCWDPSTGIILPQAFVSCADWGELRVQHIALHEWAATDLHVAAAGIVLGSNSMNDKKDVP